MNDRENNINNVTLHYYRTFRTLPSSVALWRLHCSGHKTTCYAAHISRHLGQSLSVLLAKQQPLSSRLYHFSCQLLSPSQYLKHPLRLWIRNPASRAYTALHVFWNYMYVSRAYGNRSERTTPHRICPHHRQYPLTKEWSRRRLARVLFYSPLRFLCFCS